MIIPTMSLTPPHPLSASANVLGPASGLVPGPDPARRSPRQLALQAFAAQLSEVDALACLLLWHPQAADHHCLLTWTPADGWQAEVGTEADLARALHRLGMTQRATP